MESTRCPVEKLYLQELILLVSCVSSFEYAPADRIKKIKEIATIVAIVLGGCTVATAVGVGVKYGIPGPDQDTCEICQVDPGLFHKFVKIHPFRIKNSELIQVYYDV